jgi:hypothetical protein
MKLRWWNSVGAFSVSALGSKTEAWTRMRRIGRMLDQLQNYNDWLMATLHEPASQFTTSLLNL